MRAVIRVSIAAAAAVALWHATPANAALLIFANSDFSMPDAADGEANSIFTSGTQDSTTIPSWNYFGGDNGNIVGGVWDPASVDYAGATGNNVALPGAGGEGQAGFIYLEQFAGETQPLGARLTTNTLTTVQNFRRYTLTVALGNSLLYDPGDVAIQLLVNDMVVEEEFVPAGTLANNIFTDFSTFFETSGNDILAGGTLKIALVHTYGGTEFRSIDFTNVRLDVLTVPEPTSGAAALLACGAVIARRNRRLA